MANPHRGEVDLKVDGQMYTMRLTLGAMAELETRLQTASIVGLAERFEAGEHSSDDLIALITAGLRAGGRDVSEADVGSMTFEGGAVGATQAAARLLATAFRGDS
ncbi:MAG: gene transfer agent family protein [Pikeienuella sp.]